MGRARLVGLGVGLGSWVPGNVQVCIGGTAKLWVSVHGVYAYPSVHLIFYLSLCIDENTCNKHGAVEIETKNRERQTDI